ncbi:MAG: ParB N-terminal domain-containing protein [Parasphingopyxis sp.]|nr:ParB N-terminal domain-containing protein [Sphingomonadales bacterium]
MTRKGGDGPLSGRFRRAWNVSHIPVDKIEDGPRLRPVDEVWARDLGHRMLSDGQATPIEVIPAGENFQLVIGAHRLDAARQYRGLSPIEALILDPAIAERRIAMLLADHGESGGRSIATPALAADIHALLGIVRTDAEPPTHEERLARIATLFAVSTDEVGRLLDIHRLIRARVMAMLEELSIGLAELEALARLDPAEQEKVAYLLLGGAESVAEAVGQLPRRQHEAVSRPRVDAFIALFEQMSLAEKEAALARLRPLAPPSVAIRWTGH